MTGAQTSPAIRMEPTGGITDADLDPLGITVDGLTG